VCVYLLLYLIEGDSLNIFRFTQVALLFLAAFLLHAESLAIRAAIVSASVCLCALEMTAGSIFLIADAL
jgi:hypothetical protein